MKIFAKYLVVVFMSLLIASCSSNDYIVESDFSYKGNFNRYKSYSFVSNEDFKGSVEEKNTLEKYLNSTLKSWGYEFDERKPDLIVLYSIYYDDFSFQGFNQPEFRSWVMGNYSDNEVVFKKDTLNQEMETEMVGFNGANYEEYNKISYALTEGTVLVSLFDRRKRRAVWQGYASGVFGQNEKKNHRILKSAVIRIMDEYRLLAFQSS